MFLTYFGTCAFANGCSLDVQVIARRFGFPVNDLRPNVFAWAIVSLQRRVVLGLQIPEEQLGCWLWQFGMYLKDCLGRNPPARSGRFNYDEKRFPEYKAAGLKRVAFHTLTAWTYNNDFHKGGIGIRGYARQWDDAIDARMQYELTGATSDWANFDRHMQAVSRLPF
jgi:hypothetical protein